MVFRFCFFHTPTMYVRNNIIGHNIYYFRRTDRRYFILYRYLYWFFFSFDRVSQKLALNFSILTICRVIFSTMNLQEVTEKCHIQFRESLKTLALVKVVIIILFVYISSIIYYVHTFGFIVFLPRARAC